MATEVLLMADVKDLGSEGDMVTVADGYARNFLFPKQLAAPVTTATRRRLATLQQRREEERQQALESARAAAARLEGVSCTIPMKTSDENTLYGSVSVANIVDALKLQGLEMDKDALELDAPIKELGVFNVAVNLHPDVKASVKVWVVEE